MLTYLLMQPNQNKMEIPSLFSSKLSEVQSLCEQLEIDELYFFGSSINGKFVEGKSDLDILVDTSRENIKNIVRLNFELKRMFGCSIDIFHKKWKRHKELEDYLKMNKKLIYKRKKNCHQQWLQRQ